MKCKYVEINEPIRKSFYYLNTANCYIWAGEFYRECVTEVGEAERNFYMILVYLQPLETFALRESCYQ